MRLDAPLAIVALLTTPAFADQSPPTRDARTPAKAVTMEAVSMLGPFPSERAMCQAYSCPVVELDPGERVRGKSACTRLARRA